MADKQVEQFFSEHCATPGGVIVVRIVDEDGEEEQMAVFSSMEAADAWRDSIEEDDDDRAALFVPYVIDEPDYGNVPPEEQH